jgi:hypothetical protein
MVWPHGQNEQLGRTTSGCTWGSKRKGPSLFTSIAVLLGVAAVKSMLTRLRTIVTSRGAVRQPGN